MQVNTNETDYLLLNIDTFTSTRVHYVKLSQRLTYVTMVKTGESLLNSITSPYVFELDYPS